MPRGYPVDRTPTMLGLWAITPAPMTTDEVDDLVERARRDFVVKRSEYIRRAAEAGLAARRANSPVTTPTRVAAHIVRLTGCSLRLACKAIHAVTPLRITPSGVHHALAKIYPDRPQRAKSRGRKWTGGITW